MATTVVDRVFLDTNVLVAATDRLRAAHHSAVEVLDGWRANGATLYVSGQVLREYLVVVTRPVSANGLGLDPSDAVDNLRVFRSRVSPVDENTAVQDRLLMLLDQIPGRGKQIHDANLVATMLVHGLDKLVTANPGDFARYRDVIAVLPLQ